QEDSPTRLSPKDGFAERLQISELHYRPRLVTDFFLGEDRRAVLHQLRALHALHEAELQLSIVVSHDVDQRKRLIRDGAIGEGFEG
ncbi:MAG: hypothetical protein ACE5HV_18115, partial [Acidobacteriota bacterium]